MNRIKCNFEVSLGLIGVITSLTKIEQREVWSHLADAAQVCFDRMDKKHLNKSWRWWTFPGTSLRLKITVIRPWYSKSTSGKEAPYRCEIKLDSNQTEVFTSQQVEDFLVEKILLEVDE